MDIVKKNIFSIICGVIILIALIALFWPLGSWVSQLQAQLNARASANDAIKSLQNQPRMLPNLSIDNAEQQRLPRFPTQQIIAAGVLAKDQIKKESQNMLDAAVSLNRHSLLVPDSLPSPKDDQRYKFRLEYEKSVERIPRELLNYGMPPLDADIAKASDALWRETYEPKVNRVAGKELNRESLKAEHAIESARLPLEMRKEVAQTRSIYMDPTALPIVGGIKGDKPPETSKIWEGQLSLWLTEDICQAIHEANGQKSIVDAPIKHLLKLDAPLNFVGATAAAPGADAAAANNDPGQPVPKSYGISPTGRVSCGLYDVIHFKLSLNVETAQIPFILQTLTNKRFITVLKMDVETLDSAVAASNGFIYGSQPVSRMQLECEILYLRQWTTAYMPANVRAQLGIPATAPGTPVASAQ